MMKPSGLVGGDKTYKIEIDPLTYFDNTFISNLWDNIFPTDRTALLDSTTPAGETMAAKPPNFEMEKEKRLIYHNKGKLRELITNAENELRRWKRFYSAVILVFLFGLVIQFVSIVVSKLDP
jgi:hypothetical protein